MDSSISSISPNPGEVKILGNWEPYQKLHNYALTSIARLFILQHAKLSSSIHTAYAMSVKCNMYLVHSFPIKIL